MKIIILFFVLFYVQISFGQAIVCTEKIKKSNRIIDTIATKEFESKKGLFQIPLDNYVSIKCPVQNYANNCGLGYVDPNYLLTVNCHSNSKAHSVAKGQVTAIAQLDSHWLVIVRHGEYVTVYKPLDTVYVKKDQIVYEGEKLGRIGTTDNKTIFEFQLWKNNDRVMPQDWFLKTVELKK